ncbi:DNA-3-methyladenine glycosylase [Shimazuella sp. AN120528]|uniref:DNA-3-methyladenine glycosylase family protein n=1 Tax=Shimazuella soli TaxID=1892854 RepID=UPI001F0FA78C|nr:DNA-3-methyladenine glycosylase [Shimazuella soli]
MYIPLPKEFSFEEVLRYLSRSSIEVLHYVLDKKVLKLLDINGQLILIEVSQPNKEELQIRFVDHHPKTEQEFVFLVNYIRDWLDLDTPLHLFYELATGDAILKNLVTPYYGLRIVGIPDLFEALCWAVIGQQINLTFAYTLKRRFVESFGTPYEWNGRKFWLFPSPSQFNYEAIGRLRKLQFTQKKAEYIVGIAKEIEEGNLPKDNLLLDLQKAEQKLLSIRGIGPWTAHYAMMRCFRNPSAFPVADVGLHNALKNILQRKEKPKVSEIHSLFIPWKNWEAYAVFYLWRSLEDI